MGPSIHAVSSVSCFSNGPRRIVRAMLYTTLGGLLPVGESKKMSAAPLRAADVFLDGQAASPRLLRYCTGLIQSSDFLILVSL